MSVNPSRNLACIVFEKKNQAIYKNIPDAVSFLETLTPSERYFPDPGDARREGLRRLLARAAEVGAGAMANLYDGPDEEEEEEQVLKIKKLVVHLGILRINICCKRLRLLTTAATRRTRRRRRRKTRFTRRCNTGREEEEETELRRRKKKISTTTQKHSRWSRRTGGRTKRRTGGNSREEEPTFIFPLDCCRNYCYFFPLSFHSVVQVSDRSGELEMKTRLLENMMRPKRRRVCLYDLKLFLYPLKRYARGIECSLTFF